MEQKTFEAGDVVEDLFTGNLVVIDEITDVDGDRYADISHVHGAESSDSAVCGDSTDSPQENHPNAEFGTRAVPEDLQAL